MLYHLIAFSLLTLLFCQPTASARTAEKVIIASNGAGEKFIEHTLPAVTFAATRNIDYLELHVVMTSDNQIVVFRDLTLNRLTDVADLFPDRSRDDGSYYVIDFSLKEIRQMRLKNVLKTDKPALSLAIPTLKEELGLIRRLESILDKSIGISLEIKHPWFHSDAGKNISSASLDILVDYGYIDSSSKFFIQCFDPEELQKIYAQLMPERGINLPLIQLIGNNDGTETRRKSFGKFMPYSYDWLYTHSGLKIISGYAAAITLSADMIVGGDGSLLLSSYIAASHEYGLSVFASSLNNRPETFPPFADTFQSFISLYLQKADIDGFYTDAFGEAKIITNRFSLSSPSDPDKTNDTHLEKENNSL